MCSLLNSLGCAIHGRTHQLELKGRTEYALEYQSQRYYRNKGKVEFENANEEKGYPCCRELYVRMISGLSRGKIEPSTYCV